MSTRSRITKATESAIVSQVAQEVAAYALRHRSSATGDVARTMNGAINHWGARFAGDKWESLNHAASNRIGARIRAAVRRLVNDREFQAYAVTIPAAVARY